MNCKHCGFMFKQSQSTSQFVSVNHWISDLSRQLLRHVFVEFDAVLFTLGHRWRLHGCCCVKLGLFFCVTSSHHQHHGATRSAAGLSFHSMLACCQSTASVKKIRAAIWGGIKKIFLIGWRESFKRSVDKVIHLPKQFSIQLPMKPRPSWSSLLTHILVATRQLRNADFTDVIAIQQFYSSLQCTKSTFHFIWAIPAIIICYCHCKV